MSIIKAGVILFNYSFILTAKFQSKFNTNLIEPNKGAYNADDAALNISDLQHAEHDADKKLREDVERVKTELFQFDAERNELNNLLRNNDVISCFDNDESKIDDVGWNSFFL